MSATKKEKQLVSKKEVYYVKWKCKNCDAGYPYEESFAVPKGELFSDFAKRTECPECGCKNTIQFCGLDDYVI